MAQQQVIMDEGSTSRALAAYQAGLAARRAREQAEAEAEDRKLKMELHKHQLARLKLEDKLTARKLAKENIDMLEGQPARILPNVPGSPIPLDMPMPNAPMDMPGVEELGIPGIQVQPKTMEQLLAEAIQKKRGETEAGYSPVPSPLAGMLSLPTDQRQSPTVISAAAQLASAKMNEAEGEKDRKSREKIAGMHGSRLQPRDILVDGILTRANYDSETGQYRDVDTGEVLSGIATPPTADMRNKKEGRKLVRNSIAPMEELSKDIFQSKYAIVQKAKSAGRSVDAFLADDPEYLTYQAARFALAGNLAVAQQGSRPSDADIRAVWLPLVPDAFTDTEASTRMKWNLIKVTANVDKPEEDNRFAPSRAGAGGQPKPTMRFDPATGRLVPITDQ